MDFNRESGILLHPTSLPGPYGIGEIGSEAFAFVDTLANMGQRLWQILPIGPTSYGDSPYQSLSTFAGNHLLISFDQLVKDGLLSPARLRKFPKLPAKFVDYGAVIPARVAVLKTVCRTFDRRASDRLKKKLKTFCRHNAFWLDDYALFVALKDAHGGRPWTKWPEPLALRDQSALRRAEKKYATAIRDAKIVQFLFANQWARLQKHCARRKIRLVGDIPIFVAHDSADVWAHPELFFLERNGRPIVVAGVPPDYFSATGQLWGNPLYRWFVHEQSGFEWWVRRMQKIFEMVDIVRIDHFRGFEAYWEVPAHEKTAINGRWVPGPGAAIFEILRARLGDLPIIAEDLGVITPPVEALRDRFRFPGMRVLQFAFGTDAKADDYKPHNYPENCVVYPGTHDNDTIVGWFWGKTGKGSTRTGEEIERERQQVMAYLDTDGREIHWDLIRLAEQSNANKAVICLQDLLGLGRSGRMNIPGRESGNWRWRFTREKLTPDLIEQMREITVASRRALSP